MWLRDWTRRPDVEARVLCLPPAGGGAGLFRGWAAALPPWLGVVALELPGHGSRAGQPPVSAARDLFDAALLDELGAVLDRPLALFGHSMGGRIAVELAAALRHGGLPDPVLLVAAACEAPGLTAAHLSTGRDADDAAVLDFLRRQGGTDPRLLADAEYLGVLLPVVAADLALAADVDRGRAQPLACPVHVYLGDRDDSVPGESADGWAAYSAPGFARRTFPGGHFFVQECEDDVLAALGADVRAACTAAARTATDRAAERS